MEWTDFLGKPLSQVSEQLSHSGKHFVFDPDEVDESVDNRLVIEASDKSWQMTLGQHEQIEVIFLYPTRGVDLPQGLYPSYTRNQVRDVLGVPTHSGEPFKSAIGLTASWDRFDSATHATHVEYLPDGPIAMVTLMVPEAVPGGT